MGKNLNFWIDNRRKSIVIVLDIFLILGLLSYAVIFFIINKTMNPTDISSSYVAVETRIFWREVAEKIYAACSGIYILGHILVIWNAAIQKICFSFKSVAIYFFAQLGIMFLCVVPIGIFDYTYFNDYLFPLKNMVVLLLLLFGISLLTVYAKSKKAQA